MHVSQRDPQIAAILRAAGVTTGKAVSVQARETVTLHGTYWDGGSRTEYTVIDLATMRVRALPQYDPPQLGGPIEAPVFPLQDAAGGMLAVVEHGTFCGKPATVHIIVHPEQMNRLSLAAPVALTDAEAIVLIATASLKSSYHGRRPREEAAANHGITASDFASVSATLKERGLLTKAGAITPDGRNAIQSHPMRHQL